MEELEYEIELFTETLYHNVFDNTGTLDEFDWEDIAIVIEDVARHFAEWGATHLNARKEE